MNLRRLLLYLVIILLSASITNANLTHRYNFNSDAIDSVDSSPSTLMGGTKIHLAVIRNLITSVLTETPIGDLNTDSKVDETDLYIFMQQWLDESGCSGPGCADFNGQDGVNFVDFAMMAQNWFEGVITESSTIVINEIHYHSDINTEQVEFVELYNAGAETIDLDGWSLDGAVEYTFQETVLIGPGEFIVISENPTHLNNKFSVSSYGSFVGKLSNDGERLILRDDMRNIIDEVDYDSDFPWPIAANGEGASMELVNPALDNDLAGSWRSSGYDDEAARPELAFGPPTPGAENSTYSTDVPPQIRQVNHEPEQPLSSQSATITAKVTDPYGVKQVKLKYQIVAPGSYIPAYLPVSPISSLIADPFQDRPINPEFENPANWSELTMVDDGSGQDEQAGDNIYTAVIPAQTHRTLVRYRIVAEDDSDNLIQVPYADDASFNFAYYVYDGVPGYAATEDSVINPGYVHSAEVLTSVPVYTLITRADDFYQCNGYNSADRINQSAWPPNDNEQAAGRAYNWEGTLVYDGKVYDHMVYRLRGGNLRYNSGRAGKRSMKFRFNRGNYFQARDMFGDKFPYKWQHLNTGKMFGNKCIWNNYNRCPYGINEVMDMRLFDIADVPAYDIWWIHLRVVDGPDEAPTGSDGQYNGDFWGLHLAFENYDGAFLERLGLPKGNVYKLSDKVFDGLTQQRYQGELAVDDAADYENIRWNLTHEASSDWIRNHLDCSEWYRYHTVLESIRSFDQFSGPENNHDLKNMAWYFYPDYTAENSNLGKVQFMPFDVDDTWGPYFNYGIDHGKAAIFDQHYLDHWFVQHDIDPEKSPLKQEFRNYVREFRDLHWQPEVINGMIAELETFIEDLVPADRDRWRLDPTPGGTVDNGPLDECVALLYQFAWEPGSFPGEGYYWQGTSDYLDDRANNIDIPQGYFRDSAHTTEDDLSRIPDTPSVAYIGEVNYPLNDLRFETTPFSDPQGSGTFEAIKWRIAEYEPLGTESNEPEGITLIDSQESWKYYRATDSGPSEPNDAWRFMEFDDGSWQTGQTSIGYGDGDDITDLSLQTPPMQNNYTTIYLRKIFQIPNPNDIVSYDLDVYVDDGCIIYINGIEVNRANCTEGPKDWDDLSGVVIGDAYWQTVPLPEPYNYFVQGDNIIALHVLNQDLGSSDLSIDLTLTAIYSEETPETEVPFQRHKYELQALWESDEITNPAELTVQVPGSVVRPGRTYRVRCKMKDDTGRYSHWSEPNEFVAGEPIGADILNFLRVSELMYNPAPDTGGTYDNDDFEFIELKNTSTILTLDLTNVSITDGVDFAFAGSNVTSLAPGEFVLVVRNETAFESRYGTSLSSRIAGTYTGGFDNAGEQVQISDTWNGPVITFTYNDGYAWPQAADGAGHSLVPIGWWAMEDQQEEILDYPGNWRQSSYIYGSPAAEDPPVPAKTAVLNEFMAHTDYSNPQHPEYDSNDWIELYNASGSTVNLNSNWYLSDDIDDLKKFALSSAPVGSAAFISYDEINDFHNPITIGFGLNKAGERIFLSYLPGTIGIDRVVDCIRFKGQLNGISMGKYPDGGDFWFSMTASRDLPNLTPPDHIVISEIMYHPVEGTDNDEYIELHNPTPSIVQLENADGPWRLDNAVSFTFPSAVFINPGDSIVVLPFDPVLETARLLVFEGTYNCDLTANVNAFGPYSGNLSNAGERLALEMPQAPDPPEVDNSWVIIDQVTYGDYYPWPDSPDGTGDALERISPSGTYSGDDPNYWDANTPSPSDTIGSGWSILTYDDFESGWGNYTDGGDDCLLLPTIHAHQGSYAANIQDGSGDDSSFYHTSGIDVDTPEYTQIQVNFWFEAAGMENGESFNMQYFDGSDWNIIDSFVSGTDFINEQPYPVTLYINEGTYDFPANMKLKFECLANENLDDVFIDEVAVYAK